MRAGTHGTNRSRGIQGTDTETVSWKHKRVASPMQGRASKTLYLKYVVY